MKYIKSKCCMTYQDQNNDFCIRCKKPLRDKKHVKQYLSSGATVRPLVEFTFQDDMIYSESATGATPKRKCATSVNV